MSKRILKTLSLCLIMLCFITSPFILTACKKSADERTIKLYDIDSKQVLSMKLSTYLEGVVAAEIGENSPQEALKAQAVLARTFTLNFLANNKSKYDGADISNDITEAQAYRKTSSENIKKAVKATKGQVVKYDGEYIAAYFFSNSGGQTANAKEGLSISSDNPPYLKSVKSPETSENSKNYSFKATISKTQILNALRTMGQTVSSVSTFEMGEKGESGRCLTFIVGGKSINANTFRLTVGSTLLKSTLIDKITMESSSVTFEGRGYGHGTGLSQEGAIVLAKEGKNFKEIINFYFTGVQIVKE